MTKSSRRPQKPDRRPHAKISANVRVLEANQQKRTRAVLVVEGIGQPPEIRMLTPGEMSKVRVANDGVLAEAYQRLRTTEVNELIYVLRIGGKIYHPLTICVRADGSWWLVDGLQRFMAAYECGLELPALFYKSAGPHAEALLFQAMNSRRSLTADIIVKSHQGPGAAMLRAVSEDLEHGLGNHVHFGGPGRRPYSAAHLIRGMVAAASGTVGNGKIQDVCARLDHALVHDSMASERCVAFLKLIPLVFPPAHPPKTLPMHALGTVSHRRWKHRTAFPSPSIYNTLSRINWDTYFMTSSLRFLPGVVNAIEKRWR